MYKEVVKTLKNNGWTLFRTTGSHEIWTKDGSSCPIKCTKKDIPTGTMKKLRN
ncbi:MAG: type II toxin-antitoxin system HicA family toxin [Tissierellia bacterium]|nr:type II toxin-antitoxin system HicA family toxin [Tissierellia bacterium]